MCRHSCDCRRHGVPTDVLSSRRADRESRVALRREGRLRTRRVLRQLPYAFDGRASLLRGKGLRALGTTDRIAKGSVRCHAGHLRAVSQLLWSDKDREEWFSLRENHEKPYRFGLHQAQEQLSVCGRDGVVPFARLRLQAISLALNVDLAVAPVELGVGWRIAGDVLGA